MNCNQSGAITCIGGAQKRIGGVGSAKYSPVPLKANPPDTFHKIQNLNKSKILIDQYDFLAYVHLTFAFNFRPF